MKVYFQLQLKRIKRHLIEFGIHPALALVLGLLFFVGLSKLLFYKLDHAAIAYSFVGFSILLKLGDKKRNDFLKHAFSENEIKQLRLIENGIFITPFCIFLMYEQFFLYAVLLILVAFLLVFIKMTFASGIVLPTPFGRYPFEFTAGFRRTFLLFIGAYFLAFMGIKVANFNLGAFALIICFLICMVFYARPEPSFFIWVDKAKPAALLRRKIMIAMAYSFLISLPVFIALIIFFPENTIYIIGVELLGMAYLTIGLLGKYINFPSEMMLMAAILMGASIFFPPLLILTIPYFYLKSVKNLHLYK